ncbi:MAG: ABC transporter ATP-binding protein, partial [Actinomycetota bacterium]|nr:ABC transporter ATP-binding protein [Actinomycetota bacterium]
MMGGPSAFGGQSATQSSAAAGLPFAGVPSELQAGADKILSHEPEHEVPAVTYVPVLGPRPRFGLGRLFAPRRWAAGFGLVLLILETITTLAGPVLTQQGIDNGVVAGDKGRLTTVVLFYLGVVALNAALSYFRQRWNGRLGEDLMFDVRIRLFSHFQRMSLDWYTSEKSGVLLSRMTSDVEALTLLVNEGFVNLVIQALTVTVVTLVLFTYSPTLAVILLAMVLPPLIGLTLWFRTVSEAGYATVRDRIADVLADLAENLAGVRVIAAMNRRRQNNEHHRTVVGEYLDANLYTARAGAIYGPATEAVGIAAQAFVLLIGGWMVLDGRLTLGELTAFVLFVTTFFAPIQQMVQLYNTYQQGQSALRKMAQILATDPTVVEAPDAEDLPPVEGRLEIEGVTFSYDGETDVLTDVSLTIEPGETFALVGPTGAGKSTLAKLITRFHDPVAGRVLIDGHDLRDVTQRSLRSQLGVVPQEPFLFHGTIRDNVAFASPDTSDAEILDAIDQVGLDEVIDQLPDGIDTLVHERGVSLSAGERQLLALARAFVARPRVIVLDEATSSLDLRSEAHI